MRRLLTRLVVGIATVVLLASPFAASARAAAAPTLGAQAAPPQDPPPKPHQHVWTKQTRKEWVPPVTKQVQVGTDSKGRPVYETQVVKPGYWKTTTYYACSCGATRS
jgi:hypothetical protein